MGYRLLVGADTVLEIDNDHDARVVAMAMARKHGVVPRWETPIPPAPRTEFYADARAIEAEIDRIRRRASALFAVATSGAARKRLLRLYDALGRIP